MTPYCVRGVKRWASCSTKSPLRRRARSPSSVATSGSITVQPRASLTTLRETLGLPAVADTTGFSNIGVAVIDSGIAPSADFSGRISGFYDFTNGQNGVAVAPYDDYGHGTHVAGLIAASGAVSNNQVQGVAPGVRLVGLKVLDGTGQGNTSDVIAALQYVTAHKAELNVQIVNMSLGHPIYAEAADDPLVQAVQQANAAGLIVIVSAGNYGRNPDNGVVGYTGITSPCNALTALAERESLSLSDSYAYTDSMSDLPMLSVVGRPAAVNPDFRLRALAKTHRWPVLDL